MNENTERKFLGVSWCTKTGKFKAEVSHNRKHVPVGYFTDPIKAAKARDRKILELYGADAILNFDISEYQ